MLELMIAIAIFATGVLIILEKRNHSLEKTYHAIQLLEAQRIIDEVLAEYRLYPFSEEPLPLKRDYSPFIVDVKVAQESINILPEEWQLAPTFEDEEDEKKKKRIILRVTVKVSFGTLSGSKTKHHCEISTLIRHIELKEDEEENA